MIKNSRIIKDTLIGPDCYIKGANKLKNLTINSSAEEPTQIGEGVELVNGIVGYGNRIFYGVKAVRFLTGRNVQVKYGARLLNTFLGANSTVSCCELLNNLIFPFHEQHHNNSFLTASTLLGQANIAAAASIGSNHNSRSQDGEILAGRGFWPGLASSFKHSSRFAAYVLAAKGSYPCELNITLPFSLLSLSEEGGTLELMPGYWFEHNMFAIVRNPRKYRARDKRVVKEHPIEYDFLAPDTAEEMIAGMETLRAGIEAQLGRPLSETDLERCEELDRTLDLRLDGLAYKHKVHIQHPLRGYRWYRTMLRYYGAVELKAAAAEALAHLPAARPPGPGRPGDRAGRRPRGGRGARRLRRGAAPLGEHRRAARARAEAAGASGGDQGWTARELGAGAPGLPGDGEQIPGRAAQSRDLLHPPGAGPHPRRPGREAAARDPRGIGRHRAGSCWSVPMRPGARISTTHSAEPPSATKRRWRRSWERSRISRSSRSTARRWKATAAR